MTDLFEIEDVAPMLVEGEEDITWYPNPMFVEDWRPMVVSNLGSPRFEVEKFDGQNHYVLW